MLRPFAEVPTPIATALTPAASEGPTASAPRPLAVPDKSAKPSPNPHSPIVMSSVVAAINPSAFIKTAPFKDPVAVPPPPQMPPQSIVPSITIPPSISA